MPLDVEESFLDVLLLLRSKIIPTAGVSMASNVKEARVEVGQMFQKLACVAQRVSPQPFVAELPPPPPPSTPPPVYCEDLEQHLHESVPAPFTKTKYIVIVQPFSRDEHLTMEEQCLVCGFIQAVGQTCMWCNQGKHLCRISTSSPPDATQFEHPCGEEGTFACDGLPTDTPYNADAGKVECYDLADEDDSLFSFDDYHRGDIDIEASVGMQDLEEVVHDIVEDEFSSELMALIKASALVNHPVSLES